MTAYILGGNNLWIAWPFSTNGWKKEIYMYKHRKYHNNISKMLQMKLYPVLRSKHVHITKFHRNLNSLLRKRVRKIILIFKVHMKWKFLFNIYKLYRSKYTIPKFLQALKVVPFPKMVRGMGRVRWSIIVSDH